VRPQVVLVATWNEKLETDCVQKLSCVVGGTHTPPRMHISSFANAILKDTD
jgi:hypothetical protein